MPLRALKSFALFAVFSLITLALFELVFVLYYRMSDGEWLSNREKLDREDAPYLRELARDSACSYEATLAPHPFLAFVRHAGPPCNLPDINTSGLHGENFALTPDDGKFVIMLTGGSVASQFFRMPAQSLQTILNRNYRKDGKKFKIVNASMEAWRQPNQLIVAAMYGEHVDGFISLEGFNEIVFSRKGGYQYRMDRPWLPSYLAVNPGELTRERLLGQWVNSSIVSATESHWLFGHSKLFYFIGGRTRAIVREEMEKDSYTSRGEQYINSMFVLPAEWSVERRRQWQIDKYIDYIRLYKAMAGARGAKSAFFIQPVPGIDKSLTDEEKKVVGRMRYADDYAVFRDAVLGLDREGVNIFSLTGIYRDYQGTLYTDPVHQKPDSPGYVIMARTIAERLAEVWQLESIDTNAQ